MVMLVNAEQKDGKAREASKAEARKERGRAEAKAKAEHKAKAEQQVAAWKSVPYRLLSDCAI